MGGSPWWWHQLPRRSKNATCNRTPEWCVREKSVAAPPPLTFSLSSSSARPPGPGPAATPDDVSGLLAHSEAISTVVARCCRRWREFCLRDGRGHEGPTRGYLAGASSEIRRSECIESSSPTPPFGYKWHGGRVTATTTTTTKRSLPSCAGDDYRTIQDGGRPKESGGMQVVVVRLAECSLLLGTRESLSGLLRGCAEVPATGGSTKLLAARPGEVPTAAPPLLLDCGLSWSTVEFDDGALPRSLEMDTAPARSKSPTVHERG